MHGQSRQPNWQTVILYGFHTQTFCLNVWKLLLSNMPQSVWRSHSCMAIADVFASLLREAVFLTIDSVKS
jgi:hypothetical protein